MNDLNVASLLAKLIIFVFDTFFYDIRLKRAELFFFVNLMKLYAEKNHLFYFFNLLSFNLKNKPRVLPIFF